MSAPATSPGSGARKPVSPTGRTPSARCAAWAHKIGASRAVERVPPIATASISRSQSPPGDSQPTFQKTLNPVGSLLEPIDGVPPGDDEPTSTLDARPSEIADGETRTHTVVDGDTLTRLAIQYLGAPKDMPRSSPSTATFSAIPTCCPSAPDSEFRRGEHQRRPSAKEHPK